MASTTGHPNFKPDPERGFLPSEDPLSALPEHLREFDAVAERLPRLIPANRVRPELDALPGLDVDSLTDARVVRRAMMLFSYFGHAYVWGGPEPATRLPATLAVHWVELARRLGRPPILSYASYALDNWRRIDPDGPLALGNLALLQNFLGGADEDWFILVHVEIEASAAAAVARLVPAQRAASEGRIDELVALLERIATALEEMNHALARMPEWCDPHVYYHRVRPYIHGWKDHPALPNGVVYEGVAAYEERPQFFRGETGAQSAIVPCLDAALGVVHRADPLRHYLDEMRTYMPPAHRAFLEEVESGPSIRGCVDEHRPSHSNLVEAYESCLQWLTSFRSTHLEYASRYIFRQSHGGRMNPSNVGTGGTPFMPYLRKHRDETSGGA